jgi:hypothetical protein
VWSTIVTRGPSFGTLRLIGSLPLGGRSLEEKQLNRWGERVILFLTLTALPPRQAFGNC